MVLVLHVHVPYAGISFEDGLFEMLIDRLRVHINERPRRLQAKRFHLDQTHRPESRGDVSEFLRDLPEEVQVLHASLVGICWVLRTRRGGVARSIQKVAICNRCYEGILSSRASV